MGKTLMTFAIVMALVFGVTACEKKTTAEKASDAVESAETDVKDAAKDAGEAVDDAVEDVKDAVKDATE